MRNRKFTFSKCLWLPIFIVNVLFANGIYAETITTTNSGSWTDANNWNLKRIPVSGDDVVINKFMTLSTDVTCNTLNIQSGGRLTIFAGTRVTVSGALTLNGNSTENNIEMLTSVSSTASLIFNNVSGTGNILYARNMNGTSGDTKYWHTISIPVSNFSYSTILLPNPSILEKNLDNSLFAFANYDESINKWSYWSTTPGIQWFNSFGVGLGYTMATKSSGQISIYGTPITGNVSVNISHSTGATEPYGGWGWNAIGNPFTSAISATSFYTTNWEQLDPVYGGLYVWDPSIQSYNIITQGTGGYVQMGQGFVVRSKTGGGTINFTYAMREHSPTTPYKSASILAGINKTQNVVEVPKFVLKAEAGNITRKTSFVFLPDMTTGLDPYYDAGLLASGGGMDIYSRFVEDKGINFGLQALPVSGFSELVIPIMIDLDAASTVTFSPDVAYLPEGFTIKLEDRLTGTVTLLTQENAKYAVSLPATVGLKRFYLHVSTLTTGSIEKASEGKLKVFASGKKINIIGTVSPQSTAYLYNISGSRIGVYDLENSDVNVISADDFNSGMYLIQIMEDNKQKYTGKIILN